MQGATINGYTLKYRLGEGGMAEVWYAENEIGKQAAVKILNEVLSRRPQIVERFHNEALVMVKLEHPNIRQVYGYGYFGERHCIIMEYLDGEDLEAILRSGRHFTDEELRRWWNQTVDALNYTHSMDIVHRDIKPSNIFLDTKGNIKLLDFGIAKVKESMSMTRTGMAMGTLMYMSPEQVKDPKRVGTKSDVYSLAVSFVHLLTGKPIYDIDTSSEFDIQMSIVSEPVDLSAVPAAWRGFLAPYLEKDPNNRPALRHFEEVAYHPRTTKPKVEETHTVDSNTIVPQDKPKRKTWLWITLAALFAIIVSVILLSNERDDVKPKVISERQSEGPVVEEKKESMESRINSFIQEYTSLAEASDYQVIDRLVSKLYAPSIKRYFNANNTDRNYVAKCYKNYNDKFGVYGKHSSVRWNTVSFTEVNGSIQLTYVEDYSIDRYDNSKYSVFVLEKHIELNKDLQIVSLYDVQLSKSKK